MGDLRHQTLVTRELHDVPEMWMPMNTDPSYRAWLKGECIYMHLEPRTPLWRRVVRAIADWIRGES